MKALLTPEEVGELIGYSPVTVRQKVREGLIPSVQLGDGARIRIPARWVNQYIEEPAA